MSNEKSFSKYFSFLGTLREHSGKKLKNYFTGWAWMNLNCYFFAKVQVKIPPNNEKIVFGTLYLNFKIGHFDITCARVKPNFTFFNKSNIWRAFDFVNSD